MRHTPFTWTQQYVFKPLLLGHLLQLFAVIALGARFLALYAQTGAVGWMVAVGVSAFVGMILALRYNAELVVIDNAEIVIYRWLTKPVVIPIGLNDIQTKQGLLGQLFDCGALYVELDGKQRKLASIGMLRAFQYVVGERRDVIRQLLVARREYIQAEERGIAMVLGQMVP